MDNNRSGIIKELVVIALVILLLLAAGGFLVRNVVVGLRSLDDDKSAQELVGGDLEQTLRSIDLEKTLRELAGKILPAKDKQPAPAARQQPPVPAGEPKPAAAGKKGEITAVRFFEGGKNPPALAQRTYTDEFSPRARIIYTEIAYNNNSYKIADAAIPLVLRYIDPAGRQVAEVKRTAQPKKDWKSARYTTGAGAAEVGSWQSGRYTVKVYFDGDYIGDYNFTIQ